MNLSAIAPAVAIGYLLGSIPFGYLLVRVFRGEDVRTTGSGNIGATNVARTSPVLGVLTLILDAAKGFVAIMIVFALFPGARSLAFVTALSAVCGHVFSIWLGFRGGKGVATGLGSFLLLTPKAIVIAIAVFVAMAALFRWIALASITATALLPVVAWFTGEAGAALQNGNGRDEVPILCTCAASILIIAKHHSNIGRMLAGVEPRFKMRKT
jgi:glycerol-3-phosphate acyltransferase PlsY